MSQNSLSTTFRGGSTSADEATLSNSILGTSGDTTNLASQYSACSHGKLNFVGVDNRSGTSTSISNGVVTVTLNTSVSDGDTVMRNAITSELNAQFGVSSPTQLANHVMYCLPPGTMTGIAYAFVNSWMSVYSDNWCQSLSAQLHEMGHNLNLAHASEGSVEYGDQSGMVSIKFVHTLFSSLHYCCCARMSSHRPSIIFPF